MAPTSPPDGTILSETRLRLAEYLLEPASPEKILEASYAGACERIPRVLERYRHRLVQLELFEPLSALAALASPFACFMLIHSPFEGMLEDLEAREASNDQDGRPYLEERIKLLCLAPFLIHSISFSIPLRKRFLPTPKPINYTNLIVDLRSYPEEQFVLTFSGGVFTVSPEVKLPDFSFHEPTCLLQFSSAPSPFLRLNPVAIYCYSIKKGQHELNWQGDFCRDVIEMLEAAKPLIKKYNLLLVKQIEFFIRGFMIDFSLTSKFSYLSFPRYPGSIILSPSLLLSREAGERKPYQRESLIFRVLVAAQLVHEGLHQSQFYIGRSADPTPVSEGHANFVQPQFKAFPLVCTWTEPPHTRHLHSFFPLAISVGSEIRFLERMLQTEKLVSEDREILEKKIKRKRNHLLPLLVQAELRRDYFSPEGKVLLEKVFLSFKYLRK